MARILLEKAPPIARIIFNRPAVVNATDGRFVRELHTIGQALAEAKDLRAVIITGAGRGFCSGIDLKAVSQDEIQMPWFREWEETLRLFETMYDKVVICGIHGACIGGGLQFSLTCDMRIAADNAFFSLTAVRHSIIPGLGTFRLPRVVGLGRGRLLALATSQIKAKQALEWGLVDQVVKAKDLEKTLNSAADMFLQTAPTAFRESKKLLVQSYDLPYEQFLPAYLKGQQACLASSDHTVASTAYLSKAPARYKTPKKRPSGPNRPIRKTRPVA